MPTVRTYGPRQVLPSAIPGVRKQAAETPGSRGAGLADAQAQSAEAMGQVGLGVARQGVAVFTRMQEEERQRADETALLEAQNKLSKWEQTRLYDPTNGALAVKGKDAMPLPETVGAEFEKVAGDVATGLKTDRQRAAFARVRADRSLNLDLTLRRHVFGEMQAYEQGELKAFVENSTNDAIANAQDPRRVGVTLQSVSDAIQQHGPRLGLGTEEIKQAVGAAQTAIHVGVIERLLSQDKDKAAQAYFDETKSQISGDALARVEKALEQGTLTGEAQRQSDAIISAGGTLTQQREKVRAIDDPKLRDEVMARVEHEVALTDRQQREAEEADAQQATQIVEKTGRFDAIPAPLLARLPLGLRSSLRSYALTKARGVSVETDLPSYYALLQQASEDPASFSTENMLTFRDRLDDSDFKSLAGLQMSIRNGDRNKVDKELDGFRTKSQIFDDTLTLYGIPTTEKDQTAGQKRAIAQLRRVLDQRVGALQTDNKKISNDEIQGILDELLTVGEGTPGAWWTTWRSVAAGALIGPAGLMLGLDKQVPALGGTQKRLIDITVADIPQDERLKVEDALRRAVQPVNDATILDRYIKTHLRLGGNGR